MYKSLHYIQERGILNLTLPNRLNASFNFYYFLIAVMLSYIPSKFSLSLFFIYFVKEKKKH